MNFTSTNMNDFKHYRGRGRGQFPHNNFRGNVFNNVRRTNPNAFSPLLPLPPFRDNKHRWTRPQHNPMWQRPPRMPPFLRPPGMPGQLHPPFIQDTKPPSPLPGSEEARQKAIAEASARIKQQLNLNENDSGGVTSEQIPLPNYTSFSDHKFEEIEEIPNNKPEKNLRKRNRKATEITHSVEELRNKILTQFTSMSKGKIQNLVNNPGSSKYDHYLHHLVRDMRLHLSTELRNMYNNRENDTENNEMIDHFNSIVPDLGVELVNLPDTMVAELSKILQFDINEQNNEPLVEPEHMFKQAEKLLLNTEYLNNTYEMCEPQVSDNFSPDSTANLMQNNLNTQNPLCILPANNLYTDSTDVLETTNMALANNNDNIVASRQNEINTHILSSQDSSSNLDEIPLPDFNQQVNSRTSPTFCKKIFDTNSLPDSTNIIDDNRIANISIPSHSNSPFSGRSETSINQSSLDKNHQTSVWVFQQQHNELTKTLCDSTRSENNTVVNNKMNINESVCIKPEPDLDPDSDDLVKRNRLPLDERIKMMMKMQESSPRKQQDVPVYKSKNQKKKERKRLKLQKEKEQQKVKVKVHVSDYHLDVVVKQEKFDEEENQTNSMDTFIKHVKELNESLNNKILSPIEINSPRPLIEVRKNLMPSPTPDDQHSHVEKQIDDLNVVDDTLQNNKVLTDNNGGQEKDKNECETIIEQSGNEIPVPIDNTINDSTIKQSENNTKLAADQSEVQNTALLSTCEDKTPEMHTEISESKSGEELNEQQNKQVNEECNIEETSTVDPDKIIKDIDNQEKSIEETNETNNKVNIEVTENNTTQAEENITNNKENEKLDTNIEVTLKEADKEVEINTQNDNKDKNEEITETQQRILEKEPNSTSEQPCNIDNNTEKSETCDKVIKENIQNKVEKQTEEQNKIEKESSRKHKSEDRKRDKSLEKDHKKSDRGYSAERRVSDKHYRHKSKEKHRDSRDAESSKYKSDKYKYKSSKSEYKSSSRSSKRSDDRKENKIDFEITGDSSKMLNRLMEIDLQIQKLMQEKFNIYQKINLTQHTNILTSAIPDLPQIVQINSNTNTQLVEEIEEKDTDKNNKNKTNIEIESPKKLRKRKRSPTPHHPDTEQKKCNETETKTEPEKPVKKKGKFDKKSEAKNMKKTINKETVSENDVPINEITESTEKEVKENKKNCKNDKKDKKNASTVLNVLDEPVLENVEKVENKIPKKRRIKANQTLNENVINEPNKKILLKIKKPIKKTSKKVIEEIETQGTTLEVVETTNEHELVETENKIESLPEIKEKKTKKKRRGEIINNNVEENKINTETTNNNREESNDCIESYNNNNENTEYKIKLKVSEPSSDNKSIRLKIIKSEIKKEDPENDKSSTLRRSRRNTSEEIQNPEKIIRPSSLPKKKRKQDEESRRSRSRSVSIDPEKKQKKYESSDDDEPLGRQMKKKPFSSSDSESSCIDEKRVDKKINAKRKTRRLSENSDISISESIKSNKSVPENNPLINCFVKLERCDVNTKSTEDINTTTTEDINTTITEDINTSSVTAPITDKPEDVDKDIHDIIANLDDNFEDSIEELEQFNANTENNKPELEINPSDNVPTGIFCSGHRKSILDIKILGDEFLAASEDGTIYKYCLKTGELQDAYTGHKRAVTCIYLMSGSVIDITSSLLYSGSLDCSLRCFNLDTAEVLHSVTVEQAIQCMDSAWGHIFLGTYEGLLFIYNIKKKILNDQSLTIANATVLMIKATTEGSRQVLILASRKREIMVRDAFTGLLLRTMCQDEKPTIYSLLLDKSMVYCGTSDKGIFILDFNNGTQTGLYNSGKGVVCMVMYKNLLFAGCYDGMIYVYDTKTQKHLSSISGPGDGMLLSLAISHDMIIAGTKKDHLLKIWKIPQEILNQIHQ